MVPSYQTVPLANVPTKANAPKEQERASTPVPRRKKVAVAAMMIGMALLVVGYSYGSNTHPARIDIATTTTTMTATAANLVRGGVWNGDNSLAETDGGLTTTAVERSRDNGYRCCKKMSTGCEKYQDFHRNLNRH